jgi:hypothetical protein
VNQEKPSLAEILHKNRTFVLVILGVPVLGMALAFVLILYKKPDNMLIVLAVIFFIAVQYIMMMFFWTKKVETLSQKKKQTNLSDSNSLVEGETFDVETLEANDETILAPEEERIFPTEKKDKVN